MQKRKIPKILSLALNSPPLIEFDNTDNVGQSPLSKKEFVQSNQISIMSVVESIRNSFDNLICIDSFLLQGLWLYTIFVIRNKSIVMKRHNGIGRWNETSIGMGCKSKSNRVIQKPLLKCILEYIESCPVDRDHLERV